MFYESIDLYEEFSRPRNGAQGGMLTVYARERYGDLAQKTRPALLLVAGGGYGFVSAREQEPVALRFLDAGYAVFVLDYSVGTAYPVPFVEACMGMKFIRDHAAKYGLSKQVAAAGFSAGGHLVGLLCTLSAEREIAFLGKAEALRPDAAILAYPVVSLEKGVTHEGTADIITGGDETLRPRLSVHNRVSRASSPVFIWHTTEDGLVSVENSLLLAEACLKCGVPFELHLFEKGPHGTGLVSIETEPNEGAYAAISHLAPWFSLALTFLKKRGFCVR